MKQKLEGISGLVVLFLIVILIVVIGYGVNYLEDNFTIFDYLLKIDIAILIFLPLYAIVFYGKEKIKLKRIEKQNIVEKIDIQYYREIINQYSPATLSLVYDGKIEYSKDLMASILYLKKEGYIEINENKIIQTSKDSSNLKPDLKMILANLDCFLNDKLYEDEERKIKTKAGEFNTDWPNTIYKKAVIDNLVQERKQIHMLGPLGILLLLEAFVAFYAEEHFGLFFFSLFLAFASFAIRAIGFGWNQYPKTQKGYELYVKLKGLDKYMKDFSLLTERQIEELELWDEYMIYSIIFNSKTKLNESVGEEYQKLKDYANNK